VAGELSRFEGFHGGLSWSKRAQLGELEAVLYAGGSERENLLMHAQSQFGARVALGLRRQKGVLLDFGCGTGRMLRFFGARGWKVVGTEVTAEMAHAARRFGLPRVAQICVTDGVSIPLADDSVDMIWICGVLKYCLFDHRPAPGGGQQGTRSEAAATADAVVEKRPPFIPVYRDVAMEMFRVLKPGCVVANVEMWVDARPEAFTGDFEKVGFKTHRVRVLRRYRGRVERLLQFQSWRRLPPRLVVAAGECCAALRYRLDNPSRMSGGYRDYLFVWTKPT